MSNWGTALKFHIACQAGNFLYHSHNYHKAIDMYKEAQVLLNEFGLKFEFFNFHQMSLYYKLALSYVHTDDFEEAVKSYHGVLQVKKEDGKSREWEVRAYGGISDVYRLMGHHAQSIFFLRKLVHITKETGEKQVEIEAYRAMGHSYYNLGKPHKSIECHNVALKICREIGDKKMEGEILRELGDRHRNLAQYTEAIRCLDRSLDIFKEIGERREEGYSYRHLGLTYYEKGDYNKALECHFQSLELMTKHGGEVDVGVSYNNIGNVYHAISRNNEALKFFKKSLEIMKKYGDKRTLGLAHHSLGLCYTPLGQFAEAIEHLVEAVKILEETGHKSEIGRAYSVLGNAYNAIGHKKEAMNSFKKAIECAQTIGDRKNETISYLGLGDVCICLGNPGDGEVYTKRALRLAKETGDKYSEAMSYSGLGLCYMYCGRFEESIENLNFGIAIKQEMKDRRGEATDLINLGSAYETLGKLKKAKQILQKALKITKSIEDKGKEYEALTHLGICNKREGELKKAHDCFSQSITCAERNRDQLQDEHKLSLDNMTFTSYYELCSLRISQGHFADALCTIERGRARALGDLLSKKYGIRRHDSQEFYLNSVRDLSIKNPSTILFMAKHQLDKYFWVLEGGEVQFKSLKCELAGDDIELLKSFLGGQSASECEDRSLSAYYRLKPSSEKIKDKRGQRLFEDEEEEEEEEEGKREDSRFYQWYKDIFAPIADLVQRQEIIIIPESKHFLVPFCALCDNNDKFLSETFRVRLIPSLTALRMIQDSPVDYHSAAGALIVGDPSVPPQTELPSLPGARREAMEIAELLGVSATVRDEATKKQVLRRIQDVTLIHIAAHGDAERGEIALASDCPSRPTLRKDDFMLTMEDVAKVGTRAKLVVLSCCHSGEGQIMESEGVVGISRAFLAAGARSVLVSLWAVDDRATKEFMIRFYGHLKCDKLSASEALHKTINWMRESRRYRVKDWAAFALIGDDVTLDL